MIKQFGSPSPFPALDNTEAGVLDAVTPGTVAASKAVVVDANKDYAGTRNETSSGNRLTTGGVGAVTTSATTVAEEHGDGLWHLTKLTLTNFAVGTGADAADLAIGASLYTFPAGTIMVENASLVGIFDQASHGTITDGEAGLGTVIGSTAVDTLGEVGATSENILNGDTGVLSTYVLGTTVVQAGGVGVGGLPLTILSAGVHAVFLNIAATWPNIAAAEAVTFTGVVTLKWRKIS
jgi:hypothetical protein